VNFLHEKIAKLKFSEKTAALAGFTGGSNCQLLSMQLLYAGHG